MIVKLSKSFIGFGRNFKNFQAAQFVEELSNIDVTEDFADVSDPH